MTSFVSKTHNFQHEFEVAPIYSNASPNEALRDHHHSDAYLACDDEIPTIDYSLLLSHDTYQRSNALELLGQACEEYGFFYLVKHTIPDDALKNVLKGVSNYFDPTTIDERRIYSKKGSSDKIRWGLTTNAGENREFLKVIAHPQDQVPSNPSIISKIVEEYNNEMRKIVAELAKAMSKNLGFDENYIENAFNMNLGFDVVNVNVYPPNSKAKGDIGLSNHTDPGFVITLMQDVNGGLQILSHKGKWISVYIPHHAILIQLGDHLEILTNGKYKSHVHRVIVNNNKVQRISVVTLHGPPLDKFIVPATEFVDDENPQNYNGMTYKESLKANGNNEIDVKSSLDQIKLV
ncbi:2-oxoglutarate-dependent dioxygenase 19-like [Trifolium pratense]|uniref:2-oxoglutarate-dependent dioxygenase 19-like n=1 Tax=Trifolium pratense TaxID=57577 RepID=UPI001E69352E|nr:2-oxoglutarate-dependent dioxygenase 19-like [Trifolium pratense]